jgi:hypothetical protein
VRAGEWTCSSVLDLHSSTVAGEQSVQAVLTAVAD